MPAIKGNSYAKGNPGGGAPEGNSNAVGNSGGPGAPKGNCRAAKHHGWSDSLKHYERLRGDVREKADRHTEHSREMYARYYDLDTDGSEVEEHIVTNQDFKTVEAVRDAFRKLGAIRDQWWRAGGSVAKDGWIVEEEQTVETVDGETTYTIQKANPALEAEFRLTSKRRKLQVKLGLIKDGRFLGCGEYKTEAAEKADTDIDVTVNHSGELVADMLFSDDSEDSDDETDTDPDPQIESNADATESAEEPVSSVDTDSEDESDSENSETVTRRTPDSAGKFKQKRTTDDDSGRGVRTF